MEALFITAKKIIPLIHTLIEIGWPQTQTPIQTDNSTSVVFTNKTIVNKATKPSDMKLWWLRDRESQEQFRYYWSLGSENERDYSTKYHPTIYHEAKRANPYLVSLPFPSYFVNLGKIRIPARVCCYRWNYFHVELRINQ